MSLPPRRFVSITRTVWRHSNAMTLDAIDEDGRAWWLIVGRDEVPTEWTELKPLPNREDRP
jgi:hypothetical protein